MITQEHIHTLSGRHVHDRDGDKIGTAGQVWTDAAGLPTWVSVRTGLFGLNESLVPLQDADLRDDRLVVPFDKATVKEAPNVDAAHDEPLSQAEVDQLYSYYGLTSYRSYQAGAAATNESYPGGEPGYDYDRDANFDRGTDYEAGAGQLRGDDAMTRSQKRLNVGTGREQTGQARLRKWVTTEQRQVTGEGEQTVSGEVRKERIEAELPGDEGRRRL